MSETTVVVGVALAALGVVVVWALLAQRQLTTEIQALRTSRDTDRAPILLQQQMESLRDQVSRALDTSGANLNQQLAQMTASLSQRLHEQAELAQQTQRVLGERLDNTTQIVGAVHRSLGGLEEANRHIYEIGKDIASLQEILRAPKLRGGLGEFLLEDLLSQILPAEHVIIQHTFRGGQKVDAAIRLGGSLVPIDAKFPLENFRRLIATESDEERGRVRRTFISDVKRHIDAIASKYILPDEGTFDFALMYIPAENVYYEIVVKDEITGEAHLADYAMAKRVIPVSPGSFYAYLQAVVIGLRGLHIEERAQEILQQLGRMRGEFDRFRDDFRLVAKHMNNAMSAVSNADRRLDRLDSRFTGLIGADGQPEEDGTAIPLFPPDPGVTKPS